MAFSLSFLVMVDMGTDSFTQMNLAISGALHISLGNWQCFFNIALFLLVIIFGGNDIGWGTLANMICIGYLLDFFAWLWGHLLPAGLFDSMVVRLIVMVIALVVFVFSAAIYMDGGLGTSPCDAIPFILYRKISEKKPGIPLRVVRICYDFAMILITFCIIHRFYLVTVLMALSLGPVIEFVGKNIKKWFKL